jgi:hypothetical protein
VVRGADGWLTEDLRQVPAAEVREHFADVHALARRCRVRVEMFEEDVADGKVLFQAAVSRRHRHFQQFVSGWRKIFGREPRSFA